MRTITVDGAHSAPYGKTARNPSLSLSLFVRIRPCLSVFFSTSIPSPHPEHRPPGWEGEAVAGGEEEGVLAANAQDVAVAVGDDQHRSGFGEVAGRFQQVEAGLEISISQELIT